MFTDKSGDGISTEVPSIGASSNPPDATAPATAATVPQPPGTSFLTVWSIDVPVSSITRFASLPKLLIA